MEKLVNKLIEEHQQILATLRKVNDLGIYSEQGKMLLLESKNALISHLMREDREFYPILHEAALNDAVLRRTLEIFANDMGTISKTALDFFDKYKTGGSGIEFARDFGRLFSVIQMRIGREERILYPEYMKIRKKIEQLTGI